jgi:hypothetical protein
MEETLNELKITLKDDIGLYSKKQLIAIENKCLEIHYRYPLGVPIKDELHNEFHKIYGDNVTAQDLKDFINENKNGKFDYLYKEYKNQKYFPYKKNSSSKYRNVTYVPSKNKWQASITIGRKRFTINAYESEYEAAEQYNKRAIEVFGENAILNRLDEKDKPEGYEERKKYHPLKENTASIYFGVTFDKNTKRWVARIRVKSLEERKFIGSFENEWLAALAYNNKALELFGENAKLNILTDEHQKEKLQNVPKANVKSSWYRGVSLNKRDMKWCAAVHWDGKRRHIGYYSNEIDAAKAYNQFIVEKGIPKPLNDFNK